MKDDRSAKSKVITLRVTPAMFRRMEQAAKREHLSVADWQRDIVLNALRRENGKGSHDR
jgi:predicted HicB family RNase H-like nuclease